MAEHDHDLLIKLNSKVDYIITTLDTHILEESAQDKEILYPMWNAYQQSKGAAKLAAALFAMAGGVVVGVIDYMFRKMGL